MQLQVDRYIDYMSCTMEGAEDVTRLEGFSNRGVQPSSLHLRADTSASSNSAMTTLLASEPFQHMLRRVNQLHLDCPLSQEMLEVCHHFASVAATWFPPPSPFRLLVPTAFSFSPRYHVEPVLIK
jgi:hypothetical protein